MLLAACSDYAPEAYRPAPEQLTATPVSDLVPLEAPPGSMLLTWTPPEFNVDGTEVTDLDGFGIYYGQTPGVWNYIYVSDEDRFWILIEDLSPGTWYAVATAFNELGDESAFSNQVTKEVQ